MLRADGHKPVTFSEVPDETSLVIMFSGCPNRCMGCHSSHLWDNTRGEPFTLISLLKLIQRVGQYITCVTFLGGEWEPERLKELLIAVRCYNLKTCLYTGLDDTSTLGDLLPHLDYIKVGHFDREAGPLRSPTTNQRMYTVHNGELKADITKRFRRKEPCL